MAMTNPVQIDASTRDSNGDPMHPHVNPESSADHSSQTRSELSKPSSIRFSTAAHPSSRKAIMATKNHTDEAEETTPIRQISANSSRNYHSTDEVSNHSQITAPKTPSNAQTGANPSSDTKPSWYKRIADKYGAVTLDNKGSVARDHLALERTFLAWLRTSLAFASIGIAVTQLFRLNVSIQNKDQTSSADIATSSRLPFSPMIGHGLSSDLIPVLQQLASMTSPTRPKQRLGSTLLDQLLLLPDSAATALEGQAIPGTLAFNDDAAAKLRHAGKPLGATFLAISMMVLLVGFHRYFESQYWIMRGKFPASRGGVAGIGMIAGALIIASLVTVIVVAPGTYQKK